MFIWQMFVRSKQAKKMQLTLALLSFLSIVHLLSSLQVTEDAQNRTTTSESLKLKLKLKITKIKQTSWLSERWMEVPLDHFNLFDNRTWEMRYFINDKFYKDGKPLFIEIGGEWTVSGTDVVHTQLEKMASEHQGMLVATEHRYYGKSLPFSTDFSSENLKFLQLEQALEDLAYFIKRLKALTPSLKDSKVIVHGCSYAGMLATWMRLRFPHIVDIAYASSAPLGVGLEYPEYYEAVHDVYANVSISCIDTIREGFNVAEKLMKTDDGRKIVEDALREWSCGDMDDMNSTYVLYEMVSVLNVQYDPHQFEEVSCLVLSMDSDDLSAFHRLANMVVLKSQSEGGCGQSSDIPEEDERNSIAWHYQTCTEVGFFQTLSRTNSRHPFAVDFTIGRSLDECVKAFGDEITEELIRTGIERVTLRYGGRRPKVTKVLSVQGSNDPWKVLGKYEEGDEEAPVVVLKGSHCVDMSEEDDDPAELIEGRQNIKRILSKWINEI